MPGAGGNAFFTDPGDYDNFGFKGSYGGGGGPAGPVGPGPAGGAYSTGFLPNKFRLSQSPYQRRRIMPGMGAASAGRPDMQMAGGMGAAPVMGGGMPGLEGFAGAGGSTGGGWARPGGGGGSSPFGGFARPPVAPGGGSGGAQEIDLGPDMDPLGNLYPGAAYGPNGKFSPQELQNHILLSYLQRGGFNPGGNRAEMEALRRMYSQQGVDRQRSAELGADALSDDPYLRNYARLNAAQSAASDTAQGMNQAQYSSIRDQDDFIRQLIAGFYGQAVNRRDPKEPSPWAQIGGQVLGAATGGLFGGGGGGGGSAPAGPPAGEYYP